MSQDCDHENREWDWGGAMPSEDEVVVPGYCPDCDTSFGRHYTFEKIMSE